MVTGGNSGIGAAAAGELARLGATVVVTARDRAKGEAAVERIGGDSRLVQLDLASLASVRAAAAELLDMCARIDALVLNAGVYLAEHTVTEDGHETMWQVNHLGHFLLTRLLRERLAASAPARVVVVSSTAHRAASSPLPAGGGMDGYSRSKLATVLFAREAARRFAGDGIAVNAVHPGTVRTGWGMDGDAAGLLRLGLAIARPFFPSPAYGARPVVRLAAGPDGGTGGYYSRCRPSAPSRAARDDDAARELWAYSEQAVAGS